MHRRARRCGTAQHAALRIVAVHRGFVCERSDCEGLAARDHRASIEAMIDVMHHAPRRLVSRDDRVARRVQTDDGDVDAWVYRYNGSTEGAQRIPSGDWRKR